MPDPYRNTASGVPQVSGINAPSQALLLAGWQSEVAQSFPNKARDLLL
jgi:hypothetical protein